MDTVSSIRKLFKTLNLSTQIRSGFQEPILRIFTITYIGMYIASVVVG
jgi:hypothetical protein